MGAGAHGGQRYLILGPLELGSHVALIPDMGAGNRTWALMLLWVTEWSCVAVSLTQTFFLTTEPALHLPFPP